MDDEPDVIIITKASVTKSRLRAAAACLGLDDWEHILIPDESDMSVKRDGKNRLTVGTKQ